MCAGPAVRYSECQLFGAYKSVLCEGRAATQEQQSFDLISYMLCCCTGGSETASAAAPDTVSAAACLAATTPALLLAALACTLF